VKTLRISTLTMGTDSYIAWKLFGDNRIPVYVDLHTKYSEIEKTYIKKYVPSTVIINGPDMSKQEYGINAFVPNRNLIIATEIINRFYFLMSITNSDYDKISIYFANNKDDRGPDNNKKFYKSLSKTLSISASKDIEITSPIFNYTKYELVKKYTKAGYNLKELVNHTFSCYTPDKNGHECLSCKACFRKNVALQDAGLRPFFNKEIVEKVKNDLPTYSRTRKLRTKLYLSKLENYFRTYCR